MNRKLVSVALTATTILWALGAASLPLVTNAQSTSDLQAQIAALLAQIQQLQSQLNANTGSANSYQFLNDLTVGSTGADVTALQQLLINKGYLTAVSAPTGYFGSLTQAAVAKFQAANGITPAAGYFGPKTRAFVNAMSTGTTTTTTTTGTGTTTTAPATGVAVSLAGDNPSAGSLITSAQGSNGSGAARVPVLSVNFTAGTAGPVTITQVSFNKTGVLSDSSIGGAYLTENGQVVAQYNSINQGVITFSGLSLQIPAGTTQEVTLAIDVAGGLSAGNTTGFSLVGASNISAWDQNNNALTPTGNFPLNGNTFTVTTVSNPSLASLIITSSSIGTQVTAGTQDNLVGAWNFAVQNSQIWLKGLNFHVIGSANVGSLENIKLFVNGTQVGATLPSVPQNGMAYFNASANPGVLNTGSNNVQVFADVTGSPNDFFQFEILNGYDVLGIDSQYNVPVTVTNTGGVGSQVSIQQGQITVTQDANTPTGSIAKGQSQVTLAKFDIYAAGEAVRVKFLGFALTVVENNATTSAVSNWIKNIALVDDAGGQVGTTINTPPTGNSCDAALPGGASAAATAFQTTGTNTYQDCFGTSGSPINYTIPANTTRVLSLKADIQSGAAFNSITGSLVSESGNLQGLTSSATGNTGSAQGSALGLSNSSLSVTKNNALGNQNLSAGVSDQQIGSYSFTASSAEGVNVSNVSIQATANNTTSTYLQNLKVMVNGTQFGTTQGTVNGGQIYTFSGTPFTVPAGNTVNIGVYADTLSSDVGTVSAATTLTGLSATGASSFTSISLPNPPGSIAGQNISFAGSPAITISADSTEPPAGQITMGSTGNTLGVFRFTETSNVENVKVTDLQVVDGVASTAGTKAAFSNLQIWNGSTLLGTAGSPTADASGTGYIYLFHFNTPIIVPQANSVSVTLKGDASSYASQGATDNSTHTFKITTTSDTTNATSTQTAIALGLTSNKPAAVTISSANGNTQTVLRSTLTLSVAALGGGAHNKSNPDNIGTVTYSANASGPIAINSTTITLSGSGATSTIASLQLIDANGNDAVAVGEAASSTGSTTKTFTFTGGGWQVTAGGSYTFTVRVNSQNIPAEQQVSESLTANIQNATDVGYTDGLDASSTAGLNLPTAVVPLTINSVTYPVGQ